MSFAPRHCVLIRITYLIVVRDVFVAFEQNGYGHGQSYRYGLHYVQQHQQRQVRPVSFQVRFDGSRVIICRLCVYLGSTAVGDFQFFHFRRRRVLGLTSGRWTRTIVTRRLQKCTVRRRRVYNDVEINERDFSSFYHVILTHN